MQAKRYIYMNGVIVDQETKVPHDTKELIALIMELIGKGEISGSLDDIIALLKRSFRLSTEQAQALYSKCNPTQDPFNYEEEEPEGSPGLSLGC